MAAALKSNTDWLTLNVTKTAYLQLLRRLNTIPTETANIALIVYADGVKSYILAPAGLKVGDHLMNGPEAEVKLGNTLPMSKIPVGASIHNIEMKPGKGGQLVRSAGNVGQLMGKRRQICNS